MYLDHVAFGTRDAADPFRLLVGELGATVLSGGNDVGFRSMQVFLGNDAGGMKVELLEPWAVEQSDFLERFLTKHGDGVHHLTFKVDDLASYLEVVRERGLTPVSVNLQNPQWREAFLLPREAHGTVVQLADSNLGMGKPIDEYRHFAEHGAIGVPRWWPDAPRQPPIGDRATLRRVVLRSAHLADARELFGGLLEGRVVDEGPDGSIELEWASGARLLLEATPDGTTGIHRLELEGGTVRADLEIYGTPLVTVA